MTVTNTIKEENTSSENSDGDKMSGFDFMQKFLIFQYWKEQQKIEAFIREYWRQCYARKKHKVKDNLLKARGAEFSDSEREKSLPVSRGNRSAISPTKVRTEAFKEENANERRERRERFESAGLIFLYCESCKQMYKKINYKLETECKGCKMTFQFRCTNCKKTYKLHQSCVRHIKSKHPGAKPKF